MRAKKSGEKTSPEYYVRFSRNSTEMFKTFNEEIYVRGNVKSSLPSLLFFSILPLFLPSNYHIIKIVAVKYNYFSQRNFSIMKIGQQIFYKNSISNTVFFFFYFKSGTWLHVPDVEPSMWLRLVLKLFVENNKERCIWK